MSKKKQPAGPDPEFEHLAMTLDQLWAALADGDLLTAEMLIARRCDITDSLDIDQDRSDAIFIGMAKQDGKAEGAALLRLIMQMGSPDIKRRARDALGELTARGVYPASWVTEAGKAEPVRARRVYDVFGDWEDLYVTYRYARGEHTLIARIALFDLPTVRTLELTSDEPDLDAGRPFAVGEMVTEQISLADARARLEPALLRAESSVYALLPPFGALLPIARSRLRRLPAAEPGVPELFTADDRAALVQEFLASPRAAEAVAADESATRFWAEILTAWSSRLPGIPPLQCGPLTLREVLIEHVPGTYPITPEQLAQLEAAVTAWARWSAARRGLDEEHMLSGLRQALSSVAYFYDDSDRAARRGYLSDVATAGMDIIELRGIWDARTIAIPPAEDRQEDGDDLGDLGVTSPADRATHLAAEFGGCELDDGITRDAFLTAVRRVAEELWQGEPASTRERALALLAEAELDRHDIMHALASHALARR